MKTRETRFGAEGWHVKAKDYVTRMFQMNVNMTFNTISPERAK